MISGVNAGAPGQDLLYREGGHVQLWSGALGAVHWRVTMRQATALCQVSTHHNSLDSQRL